MPDGADSKATVDEIIHGFLNGVLAAEPLGTLTVILGALAQKAASALDQQDANLTGSGKGTTVTFAEWF